MEYFILGMLAIQVFQPIFESITSLFMTMIEAAKGYFNIKIAKYNRQMKKITFNDEDTPSVVRQIGFATEIEEQEEEEYYEDD